MARIEIEIFDKPSPKRLRITLQPSGHGADIRMPVSPTMLDATAQAVIERAAGATKRDIVAKAWELVNQKGNYA